MKGTIIVKFRSDALFVNAHSLYRALDVKVPYHDWLKQIDTDFVLDPDYDYNRDSNNADWLRLSFAVGLCHVMDTDQSRACADRLREIDRKWHEPTTTMARGIQAYDQKVQKLTNEVEALKWEVARLKPKADCFDRLVEKNMLTSMADTAEAIGVAQADFYLFLLAGHYVRRKKSGRLLATRWAVDEGLFDASRTMITPKGQETFRLLCHKREMSCPSTRRMENNE